MKTALIAESVLTHILCFNVHQSWYIIIYTDPVQETDKTYWDVWTYLQYFCKSQDIILWTIAIDMFSICVLCYLVIYIQQHHSLVRPRCWVASYLHKQLTVSSVRSALNQSKSQYIVSGINNYGDNWLLQAVLEPLIFVQ